MGVFGSYRLVRGCTFSLLNFIMIVHSSVSQEQSLCPNTGQNEKYLPVAKVSHRFDDLHPPIPSSSPGEPRFITTNTKSYITAIEGSSVLLHCEIANLGTSTRFWNKKYFGSRMRYMITFGANQHDQWGLFHLNITENSYNLWFPNVSRSDAGIYICTIRTTTREQQLNFTLNVSYKPEINGILPKVAPYWIPDQPTKVFVNETDNITLYCDVSAYPIPYTTWRRDMAPESGVCANKSLPLIGVTRSQSGGYTCTSENILGISVSPTIQLVVQYMGCFDSCSKTCHCSEGDADCNSVTGECFSGVCLSGWTGQTCQIVSPKLAEPPTLVYKDCDTFAIIWNAWNRDRDSGEGPIGGYGIYFKSKTSNWSKAAFVTHDSTPTDVLGYVLIGLESDVEYTLCVAPVHVDGMNGRSMDVSSCLELVTRTPQCITETTVTPESSSLAPGRLSNRSGASVPWALFGITFVLLLMCGGVLLGLWVYRRMTLTNTVPDNASSIQAPSGTMTSSGTKVSSYNDCLYESPTFSAEGSTPERTYQGLNEGPKIPESRASRNVGQDEYAEIQDNPSATVYENDSVKVLKVHC